MNWFTALFSATDPGADSIIVGGLLAVVVLCGLTIFTVVVRGVDFSAAGFAGSIAVLLGAIGSAKRIRDGATNVQSPLR